ncbi:glycoside hydrolase family 31 protein [Pedobacter mendelii]|uniref:Alpha-xylosidase n=1 Tax=Pedobacter mendelii TaxID=1908240 RepID=A0ABQ2BHS9_9SPHI|nr:TIM-barrel domain-containing protein [Pedobacter mendelii]GGI24473.1 alpha-xylosidase [Pedobacter mendelii]
MRTISTILSTTVFLFAIPVFCSAQNIHYKKIDNGIIVYPINNNSSIGKQIKLNVISDKIIHAVITSADDFSLEPSLMVIPVKSKPEYTVSEAGDYIQLKTHALIAKVNITTGQIQYQDINGKNILEEKQNASRLFKAVSNDGEASYQIEQIFNSPEEEAIYGLGQHQDDMMNYKGKQVLLLQNNTDVAIPFLLSNKNYGILWDNYSITKVGDIRDYQPLSSLGLFSKEGERGWLTASYSNKKTGEIVVKRAESDIDYSFLSDMKKFPDSFKMADGIVKWEGKISSGYSGLQHFNVKYAGYIKIWINGEMLVDKWRQAWNPGSAVVETEMLKDKKYDLKIEWIPDGNESYLSIKCLTPIPQADKNQYAFSSESGNEINYYFVSGANADEVISGYRTLTGKAVLMPKWAMGFWQSRERYKTQEELLGVVKEFRDRKIPLDNIVLDWQYWKPDSWGTHEFDKSRFPDADGMIKTLHDTYHTRLMISVWPKFYTGNSNYELMNKNGFLYKRNIADGRKDWLGYQSTFYDAFNPEARTMFWNLMNKTLYKKGIDAWWMDATEPDIHSNLPIWERKQNMTPTYLGSGTKYFNAFPLQNSKGVYEGQRKENPNDRVFILTRSAYGGLQRYAAATWSGDIASRWEDMKSQISAGINFSLSGLPYWTMDIGGFSVERRYEKPNEKDLAEWRELNTRWYQFGAFVPLFRGHGQFPYREIYNIAPENHPAYKSILYYNKLRYRLMPYIYSLAGASYQKDYTIMRGLVMDYAADPKVNNIADEYMFGPSLLINPVYKYGVTTRKVYLPEGNGWYDLYTGKYTKGGQMITANAPYNQMPIYVKDGSIIPYGPEIQYTDEKPADPITLYVYGGKDGTFTLYEDEGLNYNYEKGAFATIQFSYNEVSKSLTISERKGAYKGMVKDRTFNIVFINPKKPKPLNFNQKPDKTIQYNGEQTITKFK